VSSLAAGTKLGPYEIVAAAGAGGMGEVYRARDTRLGRDVAIKVLPSHLSSNAEFKSRFEREAKTISSLQHPHICVLYDVGRDEASGADFLVMEYLEGETLAERLKRGAMKLDETLKTGLEIADALEKAHRQGLVHRDLKPGNVMLTAGGAKLLDFGLAKPVVLGAGAGSGAPPSFTAAATAASASPVSPLTTAGTMVGTFQYMSPEQIEGREADARSDIFALGAVLYEMATGRRAFEGKSSLSVASAILEKDPEPISAVQPLTPPALEHVVRTCLAKNAEERWQSAGDIARQLRWMRESGVQALPATAPQKRPNLAAYGALALVAAMAAVAALVLLLGPRGAAPSPVARVTIEAPAGTSFPDPAPGPLLTFSPDGRRMAMIAMGGGNNRLYLRDLDSWDARALANTEGAENAFFSPDGRWIAFSTGRALKKIPAEGGPAVTIAERTFGGGAWLRDDTIIYPPAYTMGLWRMPASGGLGEMLTTPDAGKGELGHWWPEALPSQKHILFTIFSTPVERSRIGLLSLETGEVRVLVEGAIFGRYSPSGHLVYSTTHTVMAVPFDADKGVVTGKPVAVLQDVSVNTSDGHAQFAISQTGTLAYIGQAVLAGRYRLTWVDRKGVQQPVHEDIRPLAGDPRLSPDGRRILVTVRDRVRDVWMYDLDRQGWSRLTRGPMNEFGAIWAADGRSIIHALEEPMFALWQRSVDGTGTPRAIAPAPDDRVPMDISPDGKTLLFSESKTETGFDVWALRLDGQQEPQPLLRGQASEAAPAFSPDGRFVAYRSDESGRAEVYVRTYPEEGGRWQVSTEGGDSPLWSRDGRELFYRHRNKVMAVTVSTQGGFRASRPVELFEGDFATDYVNRAYDLSRDGQRFLMVRREPSEVPPRANLVLNWFQEVRERVR
jgi:Tol biopolymer transport system component